MFDQITSIYAIISWIMSNYQTLVTDLVALVTALIAIALIIPGPEPEATLQKILDWLKKFSKK